jgi:hypothetical protein
VSNGVLIMPKELRVAQEGAPNKPITSSEKLIMVLKDTVDKFSNDADTYKKQAKKNHARWANTSTNVPGKVRVINGDWGETVLKLSKATGKTYAVLNMANATLPGGFYLDGWGTQEENMYRRTNCHFYVLDEELDNDKVFYTQEMTDLINGVSDEVYLDVKIPRICIKKTGGLDGSGYEDLPTTDYFMFYELKSAAEIKSHNDPFNEVSMRKKIAAQLNTLKIKGIRCVVLGAFGCGTFGNPADEVAKIYSEELQNHIGDFDDVVFAIYTSEFAPDNFTPFKQVLDGTPLKKLSEEAMNKTEIMNKSSRRNSNSLFSSQADSNENPQNVDDDACRCNIF